VSLGTGRALMMYGISEIIRAGMAFSHHLFRFRPR